MERASSSEVKRVPVLSTFDGCASKKTVKEETTRLNISLSPSTESNYPEFSYLDLLANEQNFTNLNDESEAFFEDGDEQHDKSEIEKIVKSFNEKYGSSSKSNKKRKRGNRELAELAEGYQEDSFVDNSEAFDEAVPWSLDTKYGGFYINKGLLSFVGGEESENEEEEEDEKDEKKNIEIQKKKNGETSRKKLKLTTDEGKDGKKNKKKNKVSLNTSSSLEVDINPKELELSQEIKSNMGEKSKLVSGYKSKRNYNKNDRDFKSLKQIEDLKKLIIKEWAKLKKDGDAPNKYYFNNHVTSLLSRFYTICQNQGIEIKIREFSDLAKEIQVQKEVLFKKVKRYRINENLDKIIQGKNRLGALVTSLMPSLIEKFKEVLADYNKMKCEQKEGHSGVEGDLISGESEGDGKESKKKMSVPRKKFIWNDEVKKALCEVVEMRMNHFEMSKIKFQSADEHIRNFLENEIKPLWPSGWMQIRVLYKESKPAHIKWTAHIPKTKKTINLSNNSQKLLNSSPSSSTASIIITSSAKTPTDINTTTTTTYNKNSTNPTILASSVSTTSFSNSYLISTETNSFNNNINKEQILSHEINYNNNNSINNINVNNTKVNQCDKVESNKKASKQILSSEIVINLDEDEDEEENIFKNSASCHTDSNINQFNISNIKNNNNENDKGINLKLISTNMSLINNGSKSKMISDPYTSIKQKQEFRCSSIPSTSTNTQNIIADKDNTNNKNNSGNNKNHVISNNNNNKNNQNNIIYTNNNNFNTNCTTNFSAKCSEQNKLKEDTQEKIPIRGFNKSNLNSPLLEVISIQNLNSSVSNQSKLPLTVENLISSPLQKSPFKQIAQPQVTSHQNLHSSPPSIQSSQYLIQKTTKQQSIKHTLTIKELEKARKANISWQDLNQPNQQLISQSHFQQVSQNQQISRLQSQSNLSPHTTQAKQTKLSTKTSKVQHISQQLQQKQQHQLQTSLPSHKQLQNQSLTSQKQQQQQHQTMQQLFPEQYNQFIQQQLSNKQINKLEKKQIINSNNSISAMRPKIMSSISSFNNTDNNIKNIRGYHSKSHSYDNSINPPNLLLNNSNNNATSSNNFYTNNDIFPNFLKRADLDKKHQN